MAMSSRALHVDTGTGLGRDGGVKEQEPMLGWRLSQV